MGIRPGPNCGDREKRSKNEWDVHLESIATRCVSFKMGEFKPTYMAFIYL